MEYELVMGLEVHVELATESKLFCSCSAKFNKEANENVCPACSGMPGLLPVTNKRAVEIGITAGLVTNCEITRCTTFDKKNYFYPDLSTGYQITQYYAPICRNGYVDIETAEGEKRIRIKQIHIEEDAGKLVHAPWTDSSLVDYNRASVPLVEVVSMPDFRSTDEVITYLEKLRALLSFAGVSDCKMQEGSMRADINVSVRKKGETKLGVRTEIKNMNSLKAIARAIKFEMERHIDAIETGCEVLVQETRRWDDNKGESFAMRNKEDATDYRYFPNPDLAPIYIDDELMDRVKSALPELAHEKHERYMAEYGLSDYDSTILTGNKNLCRIFDETVAHCNKPKEVSNWLIVELFNIIKADGKNLDDVVLDSKKLADLIELVDSKVINRTTAKTIFSEIYKNDIDPKQYVEEHGLGMISDESELRAAITKTLEENESTVIQYKNGNEKVLGFFIGKVMKTMGGKADPALVGQILKDMLNA